MASEGGAKAKTNRRTGPFMISFHDDSIGLRASETMPERNKGRSDGAKDKQPVEVDVPGGFLVAEKVNT